jgi:hypothetical protein
MTSAEVRCATVCGGTSGAGDPVLPPGASVDVMARGASDGSPDRALSVDVATVDDTTRGPDSPDESAAEVPTVDGTASGTFGEVSGVSADGSAGADSPRGVALADEPAAENASSTFGT